MIADRVQLRCVTAAERDIRDSPVRATEVSSVENSTNETVLRALPTTSAPFAPLPGANMPCGRVVNLKGAHIKAFTFYPSMVSHMQCLDEKNCHNSAGTPTTVWRYIRVALANTPRD